MQRIHLLGICGTFMGSLALLAKARGYHVSGCDTNVYPPMSSQLQSAGIELINGYNEDQLNLDADLYIIGNAISRGNPLLEAIMNKRRPYTSGPQWLHDAILPGKKVLAVSGTHGKTTTSSLLAWILEFNGKSPGFLIGGVPNNFSQSARLGESPLFVIEADEYDTAFCDKRSKFLHYQPHTLIINNLEFDHADIFDDLKAIQRQFHHVVRTVPSQGLIIYPHGVASIAEVIEQGCWTPQARFSVGNKIEGQNTQWHAAPSNPQASVFTIHCDDEEPEEIEWPLLGQHNVSNALAAVIAGYQEGVSLQQAAEALRQFGGIKRRMECLATVKGVSVYDDFAHHPTAIATTLQGLRAQVGKEQIIAIIEPRSNTMRLGKQLQDLAQACSMADLVHWYCPETLHWDGEQLCALSVVPTQVFGSIDALIAASLKKTTAPSHLLIMSNGGFSGIHHRIIDQLKH